MKAKYSITELISSNTNNLEFIETNAGGFLFFLNKLTYNYHRRESLSKGNSVFGQVNVHFDENAIFKIPGLGFKVVLNSQFDGAYSSESGFYVDYQLTMPFLRYLDSVKLSSLGSLEDGLRMMLNLLGLNEREFLFLLVNDFYDEVDSISSFIQDYNSKNNVQLVLNSDISDDSDIMSDLLDQIQSSGHSPLDTAIQLLGSEPEEILQRLVSYYKKLIGGYENKFLQDVLSIDFKVRVDGIAVGLEVPVSLMKRIDEVTGELLLGEDGSPVPVVINLNLGNLFFSLKEGLSFNIDNYFSVPRACIGNTDFVLEVAKFKVDFSKRKNIDDFDILPSPEDFIGFFVEDGTVYFPAKWNHNPEDEANTAVIKAINLLIGTGGISGTLALEAIDPEAEEAPLLKLRLGDNFNLSLDSFSLTFRQNEILNSSISGKLTLPGFKKKDPDTGTYIEGDGVEFDIDVFIGNNGDFKIAARPVEDMSFYIEKVAKITVSSLGLGEEGGKFYADIAGEIDFTELSNNLPNISTDMPTRVPVRKLRVWEDGKMEFDAGILRLPKAVTVEIGDSKMVISAMLFSSTELPHQGVQRSYNVIGFDGNLSLSPGGVTMNGDGIKIYYTTDNNASEGRDPHIFVRLEKLNITITVPEGADKDSAEFYLHGTLSIKNKDGEAPSEPPGFKGSVDFSVKHASLTGSASIEYSPQIPRWYIDAQVDLKKGIPLGATGLAIYGFKGLAGKGKRFVKGEEETWWQYYKKPSKGINLSKFQDQPGFALGLGVSLASKEGDGKPFSSVVALVLGLPDVVMLNGRANFMNDRVKLDDQQDAPFSVLLSIDSLSIQAGLGIDTTIGNFANLTGSAEVAYFWKDAAAWYVNIGKDLPETDRIKARVFDMFDAYAYLMLSASGARFGAGAKCEFASDDKKAVGYGVKAYVDVYGRLNFKTSQIGGGIAIGGEAWVKLSKFKIAVLLAAYLQAEASKPKQIKGGVDVKLELPKPLKSKGVHLEFNWIFDQERDTTPMNIFEEVSGAEAPVQAISMLTGESFSMGEFNHTYASSDDYPVIPVDSYVDIAFINSPEMNITESGSIVIGGEVTAVDSTQLSPPQKGISEQVRHSFEVNGVKIEAHNGSSWQPYNIYEASDAIREIPEIVTALASNANYLKNLPQAYWQLSSAGKNSSIRVMATNMFSYLNQALEGSIELERLGYEGGVVFCEQSKIQNKEINWENETVGDTYTANQYHNKEGVRIMVLGKDGAVQSVSSYGLNHGLEFSESDGIEILFATPQALVLPKLKVTAGDYLHIEYLGKVVDAYDHNNFPVEKFVSIRTDKVSASQVATYTGYSDDEVPVFKVRISYYKSGMLNSNHNGALRIGYSTIPDSNYNAGNGLIAIDEVMLLGRAFEEKDVMDIVNNGYSGGNVIAHWELNGNGNDASGNSHNGTATNSPVSYPGRNNTLSNAFFLGRCGLMSSATSRYFEVSHSDELSVGKDNFSVMAWVKIPANPVMQPLFKDNWYLGQKTIVSKMKRSDGGFQFYVETFKDVATQKLKTNLCFEYKTDSSLGQYIPKVVVECNDLIDGNWHHVSAVRTYGYEASLGIETNVVDLYVDGVWLDRKPIAIPLASSIDKAAVVKVNYLDQESYLKNLRIPAQSELNSINQKMKDGLTKAVQPIWRPDTKYRIIVKGNEVIDGDSHPIEKTIYFQTKGATGHYLKAGVEADDDQFTLGRIRSYIDYQRSHPNAAGQLNESKPLYYGQAKLNLFYRAPYMGLMFDQWSTYQGIGAVTYNLKVQVMDSRDGSNVSSELEPVWTYKEETIVPQDVEMLNNLVQNGPNCWGDSGQMTRKTASAEYVLPALLPANLYTATYYSVNPALSENAQKEVHKHVFQTSRYANLVEHIESFRYTRPQTIQQVQLSEDFNSGTGSFSASGDSSLSMTDMVLLESSHHPACQFTFPTIFGIPYEIVSGLKGYSYNFGGKTDFYCKEDGYPIYSGNLMNFDREPQALVYRFYSEKTGDTNIEFGMKNNKIGTLQHFVLDWMKVRIPVFSDVLVNKTFADGDLGFFQGLNGSSISNVSDALHVENLNAPKTGIYFDTMEGITYTVSFDVLAVSANGGGSQDLFCAVSGMLAQSLSVSGTFPQTLTCSFTAAWSGTQLLEIYFDSPATLGTTESFEIDNFKIEHSHATGFDLLATEFTSGPGGLGTSKLSHYEPSGVLYVEADSEVPAVEIPLTLEANASYSLKFSVPAQSYNEGELKLRIQAGSLFDVELEAGTGSEISYDFVTTDSETLDLKISLKDAGSAEREYFMIDDFSLSYTRTEDVEVESLYDRTIALSPENVEAFVKVLNDAEDQDADWLSGMPLKYDRLIAAPLGAFQACERLEIHKFVNQMDDDALMGLILRSPEPLFLPSLGGDDLEESLSVSCELPGAGGTFSDFVLVYSKDRTSVFITSSDMSIPEGEYHFNFKYLTYNGASYSVNNPSTDQYELVVNII